MTFLRVALVGSDQQDNLALGYLASAAQAHGHQVELVRFNTRQDIDPCVDRIRNTDPDVVGLGISFQYTIQDYLDLAQQIRSRGYRGHITCGGHVPTFSFREILEEAPGIDTVVRHEGEETLVHLLGLLAEGKPARGIPGLVWRESGGVMVGTVRPPISDLDALSPPKRRQPPHPVAGVPIAFLLTSRGCVGDCAYCSIRSFNRDMGGPGLRMREPEAVADEITALCRSDGIRIFFVQDDLFILPDEQKTIMRMQSMSRALRARKVEGALFWIKGRPESITRSVLEAAGEMGAIHIFLGVENASSERLRYLGRVHHAEDNRCAIALAREARIRTSFNVMLFDPGVSLEEVALNLDFLEETRDLPWNVCRTEVYSGTRLLERLTSEGRLSGDYKSYGYRMADTRAEILFRIMRVALHHRAFAFESLLNKLITLSFSRQVHEALFPGPGTDALSDKVDRLLVEVHQDSVDTMRRMLDFAAKADPSDKETIRSYAVRAAVEVNARDLAWVGRVEDLSSILSARGSVLLKDRDGTQAE